MCNTIEITEITGNNKQITLQIYIEARELIQDQWPNAIR